MTRTLQTGHDISVSLCTLIGLVFPLIFRTFHRSVAAISQPRQARRLLQSRPPITHMHSLCHEPHSAYHSAFNTCMPIHALCRSINNYRHSLTMQHRAGQMHSLAVALSKIDHCASRDTSGAFKKQSLPSGGGREGVSSVRLPWRHCTQLSAIQPGWKRQRPVEVSPRKYSCAFNDATSHHSTWIMNTMSQKEIAGEAEEEGNWDRGWSHQRIIVAILVFSPRLDKRVNA